MPTIDDPFQACKYYYNYSTILNKLREMLTDAFRVIVNNQFKENFYGKKKKINILIVFSISHKNCIKTFIKWIVNHCFKSTR